MMAMGEPTGAPNAQRTCVGCRATESRDGLLRLVAIGEPSRWLADIRRRLPGRGVSVHPTRRCIGLAVKQGRLKGTDVAADAGELASLAAMQYARRIEGLVVGALRARKLAVGTEAVRQAVAERALSLLVVASDAAGSRQDLEQAAERLGARCLVWGNKVTLGALLGRETVGVLGVMDVAIGEELRSAAQHFGALAEDA